MIDEREFVAKFAPAMVTCKHVVTVNVVTEEGETKPLEQHECGAPALEPTSQWVEPLCREHYDWQKTRPPRTELRFADGHREMRNNFVYGVVYRDVDTEFDGETGNLIPKKVTWFERDEVYRDDSGKVMLLFFHEIKNPTPAQVKRANAAVKTDVTKRVSRWTKFKNRVRLWFAMRGVG